MRSSVALILIVIACFKLNAQTRFTVGIYDLYPLNYRDSTTNKASGLFIDVLQYVAQQESWSLEYRFGTFNENLEWLEAGEIDILPNVAFSRERTEKFVFTEDPLYRSWGQIYTMENEVQDILDLEGMKIGVFRNSAFIEVPFVGLRERLQIFGVNAEIVEFEDYDQVAQATVDGEVDVASLSRIYGTLNSERYNLEETPIVYAPIGLHFGISNQSAGMKPVLDSHIRTLKTTKISTLNGFILKYIPSESVDVIPDWVKISGGLLVGLIVILFTFVKLLRYQVKVQTQEIVESRQKTLETIKRLRVAMVGALEQLFIYDPERRVVYTDENSYDVLGHNLPGKELSIEEMNSFVVPEHQSLIVGGRLDGAIKNNSAFSEQFKVVKSNNEEIWVQMVGEPYRDEKDEKQYIIGTVKNIDRRKRAELESRKLIEDISHKNKAISCLYDIANLIADPSNSIADIFSRTVNLIPSAMRNPQYTSVVIKYGTKVFASDNHSEHVVTIKKDILIGNEAVAEIIVGLSGIVNTDDPGFDEEEKSLIDSVSKQLAKVIELHRLNERIEVSEYNERERLATELHDGVQQTLTVATINLNNAIKDAEKKLSEDALTRLNTSLEYLKEGTNEIRTIAHSITLDYVSSVERFINDIQENTDTKFNFYHNIAQDRLPVKIEKELFRITQEAVNNIIKHSGADKADIQLMMYNDLIILTVEDNGRGFDPKTWQDSFGINSMRNRASSIGGEFILDSRAGHGTIITVEVPR